MAPPTISAHHLHLLPVRLLQALLQQQQLPGSPAPSVTEQRRRRCACTLMTNFCCALSSAFFTSFRRPLETRARAQGLCLSAPSSRYNTIKRIVGMDGMTVRERPFGSSFPQCSRHPRCPTLEKLHARLEPRPLYLVQGNRVAALVTQCSRTARSLIWKAIGSKQSDYVTFIALLQYNKL